MASRAGPSKSSPAPGGSSSITPKSASDPILRNALRYTISAREYSLLHRYVISRSRALKKRAPTVDSVQKMMEGGGGTQRGRAQSLGKNDKRAGSKGGKRRDSAGEGPSTTTMADDYNARAVRHSLRVFVATGALLKLWGVVSAKLLAKKQDPALVAKQKKQPLHKSPTLRLSLSLSTILLLYRLLFRFLTRMRFALLDPSAAPFRKRNPRTAGTLTSPYAPAVGASLAGLALGVYPSQQLRVSIAIFALFRALEFGWNCGEENGMIWGWEKGVNGKPDKKRLRPWWWGSWMLQPLAAGQLLHAVVFDRDCFPKQYGDLIFKNSTAYLHPKPAEFPSSMQWPGVYQIVDSLAQMARLNWPPFISPILFPNKEDTLPASLTAIAPLTSGAHPLINSLSCATLHPSDPSCTRTYLTAWIRNFPTLTRFFLIVYSAMLLPRFSSLYHFPVSTLQKLVSNALRMSAFVTGSIATAWSSICFFQTWFPRTFLPTQRFFVGGFLAGFWALVERKRGRGVFLYSARVSVDSLWKVGVKRRWWRAMKGGDVWVFVLALMLTGVVYERDARAVKEAGWRKGISWVRGEEWKDWVVEEEEELAELEGRDGEDVTGESRRDTD
ncbi:hypothetical protein B0H66DRAFT_500067 [Apodospora peruviana]|uniref:Uncharacterized protein n=1 Tax=Apodospora peruviana TaxID=516989 RepID=A0AAE0I125_9PEZI|nr:hypothetical protein B0H66DRAFT_500067 [Apodospora peruviana]